MHPPEAQSPGAHTVHLRQQLLTPRGCACQVELGNIKYDTALEIEVEHCTSPRPAISLRASYSDHNSQAGQYNRYSRNWEMLEEELHTNLENDPNGVRMWSVKMSSNHPRILGPKVRIEPNKSQLRWRLGHVVTRILWELTSTGRLPSAGCLTSACCLPSGTCCFVNAQHVARHVTVVDDGTTSNVM